MRLLFYVLQCFVLFFGYSVLPSAGKIRGCNGGHEVCSICKCFEDGARVDCSNSSLTEVPSSLPKQLVVLNLHSNGIRSIDRNTFSNCFSLKVLDVSSNNISLLPNKLFWDLENSLTTLHLENNKLNLKPSPSIFHPLNFSLNILHIQGNKKLKHQVFDGLYSLEELHLDGNIIGGFGSSFSTLKSLKKLKIFPPLENITEDTFENLRQCASLSVLDLCRAGVKSLDRNSFKALKHLRSLNLSFNKKLSLENVSTTLDSMSNDIEELVLSGLVGNGRPTLTLTGQFAKQLERKKLRNLKLDGNDFIYMDEKFSFAFRHLKSLDISNNRFSDVFGFIGLSFFMTKLTRLSADNQSRRPYSPYPDFDDSYKEEREKSSIGRNPDKTEAYKKTKSSKGIQYSKETCLASTFQPCIFLTVLRSYKSWCILMARRLKVLHLSGALNERLDEYPPIVFVGYVNVKELRLSNNGLKFLRGPFLIERPNSDIPTLMDFSYNNLLCLAPDVFSESIRRGLVIHNFNFEGNDLSEQLKQDHHGDTFAEYDQLKVLNLANNRLKFLCKKSFRNLLALEVLNLSTNSLQILAFDVMSLKNLKKLDLSNNLFVMFEGELTNSFTAISSSKGYDWLSLEIQGNPFQCSCDGLDFMHWISENHTAITDLKKVTCLYNGLVIFVTKSFEKISKLKMSCYYSLPIKISGALLALLIVCTLLGTIAYKYRWDIRYCLIKYSQNRKHYQLLLDHETDYLYDAFVSYDMNDRSWIVEELISNLESRQPHPSLLTIRPETRESNYTKYGSMDRSSAEHQRLEIGKYVTNSNENFIFKLCIHERDFEPGNAIESNILRAIQGSRTVILIVSNHFIKSKWCRLELEMAKIESLERGRNVVVIVFLESIRETLESLEWLMKRYTYLEWFKCDTISKKEEFWKMLRVVLGSKQRRRNPLT